MNPLSLYLQDYYDMPASDVEAILHLFETKEVSRETFLMRKGDRTKGLNILKSGIVRVYDEKGDQEITQWIATEGGFVTDLRTLFFDSASRWNMQAITDCELYTIQKEKYNELEKYVSNWKALENRFLAKCFVMLEERVFEFLSSSAEERFLNLMERSPQLFNHVPLQYLSSMMGMRPETLSRLRAKQSSNTTE